VTTPTDVLDRPAPTDTPAPDAHPHVRRTARAHARRVKRQNAAVVVVATFVGLWLGLGAPDVSPVSPAARPAAAAPAATPAGPAAVPVGTGGPG
jgi:hypothetical protein